MKIKKIYTEIDKEILKSINIIPVSDAKSIFNILLVKPIIPLNLSESDIIKNAKKSNIPQKLKNLILINPVFSHFFIISLYSGII